ncbi:hypothetical protein QBC43DRAFT_317917 [Cladorrhinum sp. PSN259]|nr:hypothetical protein QBC43DRAFT_317917 [Cladorrhinum sp. PSN259]
MNSSILAKINDVFPSLEKTGLVSTVAGNRGDIRLLDTAVLQNTNRFKNLPTFSLQPLPSLYLDGNAVEPDQQFGRVRLVLAKCTQYRHTTYTEADSNKSAVYHTMAPQACTSQIPLTILNAIVEQFKLPAATAARIISRKSNYGSAHFQTHPLNLNVRCPCNLPDCQGRQGITLKLPDSAVVGTAVALSLSHCSKTNTTEGILLCSSEDDLNAITETIIHALPLIAHPAALPTIICGLYAELLDQQMEMTWQETFRLETESKQSGLLLLTTEPGRTVTTGNPHNNPGLNEGDANYPLDQQDLFTILWRRIFSRSYGADSRGGPGKRTRLALNQWSIKLAQLALAWEKYTPDVAVLAEGIEEFLRKQHVEKDGTDVQQAQRNALMHRVEFLRQDAEGRVQRAKYMRGRLELQNAAVNNYMGLEVARAMKYLTLLGLVFLPSACIAEMVSVPSDIQIKFGIASGVVTAFLMGIGMLAVRVGW